MSWTFRDKITDFVTRVATTARRRRDNFQKKIARVAAALNGTSPFQRLEV